MTAPCDLRLYSELAPWWPLLSAPEEYRQEAAWFTAQMEAAAEGSVRRVLELGSGGGNNASHMKAHFTMTLTDLSPHMLEVSRRLNPECEHLCADMRSLRLGRTFDAVFVHDAADYLTSEPDLHALAGALAAHCRSGGAIVVAPDFVRATFRGGPSCGGHDGPGGAALRYLEWIWDPDPADTVYQVDYVGFIRDGDGRVRSFTDRHICGLFPEATWRAAIEGAGFRVTPLTDSYQRLVFVGVRR